METLKKKLTLQEAVDFLDHLLEAEDSSLPRCIYIDPPRFCGSAKDDDEGDEQIYAQCEIVWANGLRNTSTIEEDDNLLTSVISNIISETQSDTISAKKQKVDTEFTWEQDNKDRASSLGTFPELECTDEETKMEPFQYFEKFFDSELINYIVEHTNQQAVRLGKPNKQTTPEEFRAFIGVLLISGYNPQSKMRDMWSDYEDLRNIMVSNTIFCSRFLHILQFLNCEDCELGGTKDKPNKDKLWKLRTIISHIKRNMLQNFEPEQNLAYAENLIPYNGRHGSKQFIKDKPFKFGYKVWTLCTQSGYMVNFEISQGINRMLKPRSSDYESKYGKFAAPLLYMIDEFDDTIKKLPFHFYFDNLFTSIPLLIYLKSCGFEGTGTIREIRIPASCPIPNKDALIKQKRGFTQSFIMTGTQIKILKWVDNSVVCMASTCFGVYPKSTASRYSREVYARLTITHPNAVIQYDKNISGSQQFNINIRNYRIQPVNERKWWCSIFMWLIDACLENAWQLYRRNNPGSKQLDFRRRVASYYCVEYGCEATTKRRRNEKKNFENIENSRFDGFEHYVQQSNRRRCAAKPCTSITCSECSKCKVGICVKCFAGYHTKKEEE